MKLLPLFLVSLAAVGYETALTRYFAVAKWSEYGYWVISIVMVGFALSGVSPGALAGCLRAPIDVAAGGVAGGVGAERGGRVPFYHDQPVQSVAVAESGDVAAADLEHCWLLCGAAAVLFPGGLFISLSFVRNADRDRVGLRVRPDRRRGTGAAGVLGAMYTWCMRFSLVPLLLVPLALSAAGHAHAVPRAGRRWRPCCHWRRQKRCCCWTTRRLITISRRFMRRCTRRMRRSSPRLPRRAATMRCWMTSPSAWTPTSRTTPACWAWRDRRAASGCTATATASPRCPSPADLDSDYAAAALDALPYQMVPHARVLLAGDSGGFRAAEALRLEASQVRVLEPEPVLFRILRNGTWPGRYRRQPWQGREDQGHQPACRYRKRGLRHCRSFG